MLNINEEFSKLLKITIDSDFSDLHITANSFIHGRKNGQIVAVEDRFLSEADVHQLFNGITSEKMKLEFHKNHCLDSACSFQSTRFRLNFYKERGFIAIAVRRLNDQIQSFDDLGLPEKLLELTELKDGLVLFSGPTGSGKSTSLAALIDSINQSRACHILTIEDPIEYVHLNRKSLVHQRELGTDVLSFSESLRDALREDPDVILVGEMRDLPTIRAAVTAAETGHLVFSTVHSGDTVGALDRILAMYPAEEQESARRQLAMVLKSVVAQSLLPLKNGTGRIPVLEILRSNAAVKNLIHTHQFTQIYSVLETGSKSGMQSIDFELAKLILEGKIDYEMGRIKCRNSRLLEDILGSKRNSRSFSSLLK